MSHTLHILADVGIADAALLATHVLLCIVLLYGVFCRAVRSDRRVRRSIRWAFNSLGTAACAALAAPLQGWRPDGMHILLLAAICAVQLATARYWHAGVPTQFLKPECRPASRRAGDCS